MAQYNAPAPWKIETRFDGTATLLDCNGRPVIGFERYHQPNSSVAKTLDLIEAAPKLLEALKVAHGVVLWAADNGADEEAIVAIEKMVREAIAQAERW